MLIKSWVESCHLWVYQLLFTSSLWVYQLVFTSSSWVPTVYFLFVSTSVPIVVDFLFVSTNCLLLLHECTLLFTSSLSEHLPVLSFDYLHIRGLEIYIIYTVYLLYIYRVIFDPCFIALLLLKMISPRLQYTWIVTDTLMNQQLLRKCFEFAKS